MDKQAKNNEQRKSRRALLKGTLGVTAAVTATAAIVPSRWTKPVVNAIVLPVHAQTSPEPPEPTCPELVIGNIVTGPVSGQAQCTITFDMLSADAAMPVTVTDISNSSLVDPDTVTYNGFGEATDTTGPRVVFQGATTNAPFECTDPINEVTFSVTFTCEDADPTTFTQDFLLSEIGTQAA